MKVELVKIEVITPYRGNPRRNAAAVDAVCASIQEFGWRVPIVVDSKMVIVAGHTRYLAARKLGLKRVPVHVAKDLTPAQARAYRLADNKTGEAAAWDGEMLAIELKDLRAGGFDVGKAGFDSDEVAKILKRLDLPEDDPGPLLDQSVQLKPPREYAVVMCDDADEWERLKVALDLQPVRRGGYKPGSSFDHVGTQRVVKASELLPRLEGKKRADRHPK